MHIGLKNIQHRFSDCETLLIREDGIHCLTGWLPHESAPVPYELHSLYTCVFPGELVFDDFFRNMHVLCAVTDGTDLQDAAKAFPEDLSLLLVRTPDLNGLHLRLQRFFHTYNGVGLYCRTLLEYLNFEDGLQPAIEYSWNIFQNPIFVFDPNYNLIAATWNAVRDLGMHDPILESRVVSGDDFKMVNRDNIHNRVQKSEIPIRAYNEKLGCEQMYCMIDTAKDLGHIVVSAVNQPFEDIDTEFMLMLKKFASQQLRKDAFVNTSRGFNYEYFLRDLLDKKIATDRSYLERMNYVNRWFSGLMYAMVVETARSMDPVSPLQIRNIIEGRVPNVKTFVYSGQIIAVLNVHAKDPLPDRHVEAAQDLCKEYGLFAGLSNCFTDILQFEEYYNQALRAIELGASGRNVPGLYLYREHYLDHLTTVFTLNESPETFCHPKMKVLMEYDSQHRSEYAYTLYMYLLHERNLVVTAEAMNMHRSSLVYRFKKITSLIGEDDWDSKERLYMILSYEVSRKNDIP